ncbi:hypothetical protein DSM106972_016070 [Dulcicalothrix desertica PCC 7102]|uniref:Uncharacterized protein n=1 Tax=Dulcicalothrix desertica PCC 7102 TaxID=232991 RepID=A0A3S1AQ82_9CYAN|nr:hypothetical protein [Dulcicalothrix desertica]RUT08439.1 hypothetical protein DSM106972_016070 [Dulcicalothrix desertica PCC 7102]
MNILQGSAYCPFIYRELHSHLLTLLGEDTPRANQLIEREKKRNPGYSETWYLEKVINGITE